MVFLYAALIGLAAFLGVAPAGSAAELATYYHAGAWDAFSGRDDQGHLACGIGNTNPSNDQRLMFRFTVGQSDVVFTVAKPTWAVPNNTQATVVMQVGLERPWTEQASGNGQELSWRLTPDSMQIFDAQFRRATSMTLAFPDGNEPAMVVPLAGSTAISDAFRRCIADFSAMTPAGTAPLPGSQGQRPTQPFGVTDPSAQAGKASPTAGATRP